MVRFGMTDGRFNTWLVVVILAFCHADSFAGERVRAMERSLASNPEIFHPGLRKGNGAWELYFDARFLNDCLADTGIRVVYSDLGNTSFDENEDIRLVEVVQKVNPAGCPDIYMPVQRRYRAEMLPAKGVQRVVLMNCFDSASPTDSELQICSLVLGQARPRMDEEKSYIQAVAEPRSQSDYLPVITNVQVSGHLSDGGRFFNFSLSFDVVFPSRYHAKKGIEVEMIESPLGVSDRTGSAVLDWLAVVNPGVSGCPADNGEPIVRRYEVSRSVRSDYRRKLVVINRTAERLAAADLFSTQDIWTGCISTK